MRETERARPDDINAFDRRSRRCERLGRAVNLSSFQGWSRSVLPIELFSQRIEGLRRDPRIGELGRYALQRAQYHRSRCRRSRGCPDLFMHARSLERLDALVLKRGVGDNPRMLEHLSRLDPFTRFEYEAFVDEITRFFGNKPGHSKVSCRDQ